MENVNFGRTRHVAVHTRVVAFDLPPDSLEDLCISSRVDLLLFGFFTLVALKRREDLLLDGRHPLVPFGCGRGAEEPLPVVQAHDVKGERFGLFQFVPLLSESPSFLGREKVLILVVDGCFRFLRGCGRSRTFGLTEAGPGQNAARSPRPLARHLDGHVFQLDFLSVNVVHVILLGKGEKRELRVCARVISSYLQAHVVSQRGVVAESHVLLLPLAAESSAVALFEQGALSHGNGSAAAHFWRCWTF